MRVMSKDHHKKLSPEERDMIAVMRGRGESLRGIATELVRSPVAFGDRAEAELLEEGGICGHTCSLRRPMKGG